MPGLDISARNPRMDPADKSHSPCEAFSWDGKLEGGREWQCKLMNKLYNLLEGNRCAGGKLNKIREMKTASK
jgi:hypothetical protein